MAVLFWLIVTVTISCNYVQYQALKCKTLGAVVVGFVVKGAEISLTTITYHSQGSYYGLKISLVRVGYLHCVDLHVFMSIHVYFY